MSIRGYPIKSFLQDWFQSKFTINTKFKTLQVNRFEDCDFSPIFWCNIRHGQLNSSVENHIVRRIPEELPFVEDVSLEEIDPLNLSLSLTINRKVFIDDTIDKLRNSLDDFPIRTKSIPTQPIKQIVEFSSPNIAKPFHCGNLRSTIIGNAVSNIKSYLGNNVIKLNYLGDWGTQFGLLSYGYDKFGNQEELETNPIKHLLEVYVKANQLAEKDDSFREEAKYKFSQMEKGLDDNETKKWNLFREYSMKEYDKVYRQLGVNFDEFHFESMYGEAAHRLVNDLELKGFIESDGGGSKVIPINGISDRGKTDLIPLIKSDESSLYIARDLAAAIDRKEKYNFNEMYYVVGRGQAKHFRFLKAILEKTGYDWAKNLIHVGFGHVRGMSTRKGEIVFLEDIINEARQICLQSTVNSKKTKSPETEFERLATVLGLSSVFINDLKNPKGLDYTFDWKEATNIKGFSGISLQYSHARTCSIQKLSGIELNPEVEINYDALEGSGWDKLLLQLSRFDDALDEASTRCEPSILVRYLLWLSRFNNGCIEVYKVKGEPNDIAQTRLLVYHCAQKVLKKGINLIGLEALDQI